MDAGEGGNHRLEIIEMAGVRSKFTLMNWDTAVGLLRDITVWFEFGQSVDQLLRDYCLAQKIIKELSF